VWSQGVRKFPHVVGDRLLNVVGIGPSHKTRRSLGASQTWSCSRTAAITKWACTASDVSIEKVAVCGKGESMKRVRAKVPAVSDTSPPDTSSTNQPRSIAISPSGSVTLPVSDAFRSKCLSFTSFEAKRRVMEEIGK
jgi:hypothetical protein